MWRPPAKTSFSGESFDRACSTSPLSSSPLHAMLCCAYASTSKNCSAATCFSSAADSERTLLGIAAGGMAEDGDHGSRVRVLCRILTERERCLCGGRKQDVEHTLHLRVAAAPGVREFTERRVWDAG